MFQLHYNFFCWISSFQGESFLLFIFFRQQPCIILVFASTFKTLGVGVVIGITEIYIVVIHRVFFFSNTERYLTKFSKQEAQVKVLTLAVCFRIMTKKNCLRYRVLNFNTSLTLKTNFSKFSNFMIANFAKMIKLWQLLATLILN